MGMSSAPSTADARLDSAREETWTVRTRAMVRLGIIDMVVFGQAGNPGCGDETLTPDHAAWFVGPGSVEHMKYSVLWSSLRPVFHMRAGKAGRVSICSA